MGETSLTEVMSCRVCRWFVVQQTGPLWRLRGDVRFREKEFEELQLAGRVGGVGEDAGICHRVIADWRCP